MGQIIIEIPKRVTRRFRLDSKRAADLISYLEDTTEPLADNLSEDLIDSLDAQKSLEEYLRTGKSFSWESIKAESSL